MKVPNMLTLIRFLLIPLVALMLYSNDPNLVLISIGIFIFAIITDWADGYIARNFNLKSKFGTFFDPIVDKMLILTMFFIFSDLKLIPLWMILLILFREFLVTGIRQVCSTGTKIVGANWMGKTKFSLQAIAIVYLQLFLYFRLHRASNVLFNETAAFYFVLVVVIVSLAFALNFLYWHRKEILEGI
jgi:CDP-diacylglycerol--glycerol-3-phosphate 3-phosphatidyltransferase